MLDVAKSPCAERVPPRFAKPRWTTSSAEWQRLDAQLPSDHVARLLADALQRLNLAPLWNSYTVGGTDALRPDLLLTMVLVEMWNGRRRPSQWHRDALENIALQWVGFGLRPCRSTWYNVRDRLGPFLDGWFAETLDFARQQGITPGTRGALDGSFVAANASRHRLLNQERLEKRSAELATIAAAEPVESLDVDLPTWMARTPANRAQQRKRYDAARERMQEMQATNRRQPSTRRRPAHKIVVSVTDPEAAIGKDKEGVFRPLYNVQLLADLDSPLYLAYDVLPRNNDAGTLPPMVHRAQEQFHLPLSTLLCDAGYVKARQLAFCAAEHIDLYGPWQERDLGLDGAKRQPAPRLPKEAFTWEEDAQQYRCPEGHPLTHIGKETKPESDGEPHVVFRFRCAPAHCSACPRQKECTTNPKRGRSLRRSEHQPLIDRHCERMKTPEALAIYRLRKQTVELGYAELKHNREFRRFSGRGLERARIEIGLMALAHNLHVIENAVPTRLATRETTKTPYVDTS